MKPVSALLVGLLVSCGGGRPEPVETIDQRLDERELASARERAPDMVAAAERAREAASRAQEAGDVVAADDHATRARLLLAAAVAESDRIDAEQRRIASEARADVAEETVARDRAALARVEEETRRLLAARVAREVAAQTRAIAELDEARRYRASAAEREAMYAEASVALQKRARLVLAAAEALGTSAEDLEPARDLIDRARTARPASRAMQLSDDGNRAALRLLGEARARGDAPSAGEVGTLMEALRTAGFTVDQLDRGLAVTIESGNARASASRIRRFADIASAHPHGPLQVEATGAQAAQRGSRIVTALTGAGIAEARVRAAPHDGAGDPRIDVVFVAYSPIVRHPAAPSSDAPAE